MARSLVWWLAWRLLGLSKLGLGRLGLQHRHRLGLDSFLGMAALLVQPIPLLRLSRVCISKRLVAGRDPESSRGAPRRFAPQIFSSGISNSSPSGSVKRLVRF